MGHWGDVGKTSLLLTATAGAIVGHPGTAEADHGPNNHAPFAAPFADSSTHTYASSETHQGFRGYWEPIFDDSMINDYGTTDLTTVKLGAPDTADVFWFVTTVLTPGAAADATCVGTVSGGECSRFRIRIAENAKELSTQLEKNLTCHEIGHTVGFRDGGTARLSCMDGGDNAILGEYEKNRINGRY